MSKFYSIKRFGLPLLSALFFASSAFAVVKGDVGIFTQSLKVGGTSAAGASAALEISSTTKGLLISRMTETQRDAISSPATGLMIFNTTTSRYNFWDGDSWEGLTGLVGTANGGTGQDFSSSTGLIKVASGTASASTLVNADVNASAAIALSKLATVTASRVLVSDASGFITPSTTTASEILHVNGVTSSLCGISQSCTLTNKTLTSPVLNTGVSGTAVKDEDDMSSDSASHLATQQSIKAYADTKIAKSLGTTKGDIIAYTGSGASVRLGVGSNDQVLTADSGQSSGIKWAAVPGTPPSGLIIMFGGSSCPAGYLAADGSAVSRSTYSSLFTAISTTWGSGDGSTTFNVPNLTRRIPLGSGGSSANGVSNSVGSTGGAETHTHDVPIGQGSNGGTNVAIADNKIGSGSNTFGSTNKVNRTNTNNETVTSMQSYASTAFAVPAAVVTFCIKE